LDTTTKGVVALAWAAHSLVAVNCSGSLLAPNLVLTARHCVNQIDDGTSTAVTCDTSQFTAQYNPRELFVSTDAQPRGDSTLYGIKEIREAPGGSEVCGHDLALLILGGTGIPRSEATPIEPVLDHTPGAKQSFSAVGYGLQDPEDDQSFGTRMRFDTSTVTCVGSKCPRLYEAEDNEWVGKSPVCSGDSGGPALDTEGRVFGVTSRGDNECTFAIYSNVANWADFVRNTALVAAKSGGYNPASWVTVTGASGAGGASGSANAGTGGTAAGGADGAGASSAAGTTSPPAGPAGPTVDPLGMSCTGECPGSYKCYSATGTPPGICVPPCGSVAAESCPERYACSPSLGACIPTQPTVKTAHLEASCAVSPGVKSSRSTSALNLLLGLAVFWLGRRRRQLQ
jgi:MYXO-CTERM domain-containing protein